MYETIFVASNNYNLQNLIRDVGRIFEEKSKEDRRMDRRKYHINDKNEINIPE